MIVGRLASKRPGLEDWWTVGSATCLCAYQAKGALSEASAKEDLTANGYDLTGASPSWSALTGWAGGSTFDTISGLTLPTTISVVWAGDNGIVLQGLWNNNATSFAGLVMANNDASGTVTATYNATNVALSGTLTGGGVIIYTKEESTNSHELFIDGTSTDSNTNGTTPTELSARLYTGSGLWAAALYDGILSGADITSISNFLNAL